MYFGKIIVKGDYSKEGDLVFRPLLKAYKEAGLEPLIQLGNAIIIGVVDKDGIFNEWFTGNRLYYNGVKEMDMGDIGEVLRSLDKEKAENIRNILNTIVFKRTLPTSKSIDYLDEQKKLESDNEDLMVEARAYDKGLSLINPYDKENLNGYRDFLYKVSKLNEHEKNKSK